MMSPAKLQRRLQRGYVAHRCGDLSNALGHYQAVLEQEPRHPAALHYAALLGRALNQQARNEGKPTRDDAVRRLMAMSVAAAPTNAAAIHNFAKFEHDAGNVDVARQLYEQAVRIQPEQGESWTNLGNVFGELGRRIRAEACWHRAMECPSGAPDARFNLSFLKLLKGDYAEGWRDYESRWACPEFVNSYGRSDLVAPRWDGSPVDTLYLHGEQGAGDALMMARFVPLARAHVGRVVVEVISGLAPLFAQMFPGVEIVARGDDPPEHDAQLPMMSLPAIFGATRSTIPAPVPFQVDQGSIQSESGRIGLCWRGSTTHTNDRVRSMPFEAAFPLLDLPGLTWQSLQFGYETSAPLDHCPMGDFLETARAIARCSLVITVDTSIAHLAGSMGVPTWILLPFVAEWRWLQDCEDSPWYPSARLWRQDVAGDWDSLVWRVAAGLARGDHVGDRA